MAKREIDLRAARQRDRGITMQRAEHPNTRPRDAATLVILRNGREVLLGKRSARHVFMPQRYVFPGGRVDPGDSRVPCPVPLKPDVEARLLTSATAARARALAMAAVRETFEETGLLLGVRHTTPLRTRSASWQAFYASGLAPALDKLFYFGRAITPPRVVRRFDARFFLTDARHMHGELRGNGELVDLQWLDIEQTHQVPLAPITDLMLHLLRERLLRAPRNARTEQLLTALAGSELMEYS